MDNRFFHLLFFLILFGNLSNISMIQNRKNVNGRETSIFAQWKQQVEVAGGSQCFHLNDHFLHFSACIFFFTIYYFSFLIPLSLSSPLSAFWSKGNKWLGMPRTDNKDVDGFLTRILRDCLGGNGEFLFHSSSGPSLLPTVIHRSITVSIDSQIHQLTPSRSCLDILC